MVQDVLFLKIIEEEKMSSKRKGKDSPTPVRSLAEIAREKLARREARNKTPGWMTCGGETLKTALSKQDS